jgi:ABC-type nitrate/sulfonate/bicarbonate transport system permease component
VRLDTALLFAAVVVLSLLGVLLFNLVARVTRTEGTVSSA